MYVDAHLGHRISSNPIQSIVSVTRARKEQRLQDYRSALSLHEQKQVKRAEVLLRRLLASLKKRTSGSHPFTLEVEYSLARAIFCQDRYSDAEAIFMKVWKARRVELGEEHLDTVFALQGLWESFVRQGQLKKAVDLLAKDDVEPEKRLRSLMVLQKKMFGEDHAAIADIEVGLAVLFTGQVCFAGAEDMQRKVVASKMKALGQEHPDTLVRAHSELASWLLIKAVMRRQK